eukprot:CAMPEP_0206419342 /NCGR_PEP_ID=MMETSP0324_2-20121206/38_1 /ASSEMBLY_ACC=CAM_ASM_000836 /TAXON_ID=2866 /ORGANISM="Crypthecodinium cohnii, Strain Seligo" /LENGTH=39 /DNA_ID= /DNA_START= /DNA_END= /DNA_ORIENTATION=
MTWSTFGDTGPEGMAAGVRGFHNPVFTVDEGPCATTAAS